MNIVQYGRQLFPLNCGITDGMDITCDDLKKPGGVYRVAWVFNLGDLRTPIDVTLASYITNLNFNTYVSLYRFESAKFTHEGTWVEQVGDSGNVSYQQTAILRLANANPTADRVIENASVAELGIIFKTNAGEFLIYGAGNGLAADASTTGGTGRQSTDSTFTTLNLVGTERYLPKRLLIGGSVTTTQQYLDAASS